MEASRFDRLVRQLLGRGTRRGLLRVIASLPIAGSLGPRLGPGEAVAKKRKKPKRPKKPPTCTPICVDKECGPDGCGGDCPPGCGPDLSCDDNGACQCASGGVCDGVCCAGGQRCHRTTDACCSPESETTTCGGRECGEVTDSCGETVACGDCAASEECDGGQCVCAPDCRDRSCGSDGCDGSCGECPVNRDCDIQGQCVCRFAACNGACCGQGEACQNAVCTCVPDCTGKACGANGCGGSCGNCGEDQVCQGGSCVARPCDVCAVDCAFTSVQAAINAASPGATVLVCPGEYRENLSIRANLRLIGAGDGTSAGDTILRGTGTASVAEIASGATVTLRKLRMTGGRGALGVAGGVFNRGTTTIVGCTITGNTSGNAGGGLGNFEGTLTLANCRVTGNTAENWGGGIDNRLGALVITNSVISGNTASGTTSNPGGGGIHTLGGTVELTGCAISDNQALIVGGGIYAEQAVVTLTDCAIDENAVTFVGVGINTGNRGGGIASEMGTLTLTRGTVSGNTAHQGGGIYLTGDGEAVGKLTLVDSEVSGNQATRWVGGGIRNASGAVELINSVVRGNSACCETPTVGGGGISTLFGAVKIDQDSRVTENAAEGGGGGIFNSRSAVGLASFDIVVGNSPNNCAGDPVANCQD